MQIPDIVTYSAQLSDFCFVQDSTGGIFVGDLNDPPPKPSDLVEISGVIHPGAFAPIIGQPSRLFGAFGIPKKVENIVQPRTREDALIADVFEAAEKVAQQVHLDFVGGREIAMAALRGKWPEPSIGLG